MGGDVPKQFQLLGGQPLLLRTLAAFAGFSRIVVVTDPVRAASLPLPANVKIVPGGATRQDSVRLGLEALAADPPDVVLVHDAARPFVSSDAIQRVLAAVTPMTGAILAVPVADTLKQGGSSIDRTVNRTGLWAAQTPQAFPFALLLSAHRQLDGEQLTDDAALFEAFGHPVALVPGERQNFKITTAADMQMAENMIPSETRVGSGFDVHAFCPGDHVMLGGVRIPHDKGLAGHSDADVVLHALTDALLGAIGAGDIGQHFPPTDLQWKGKDSRHFLRHAVSLLLQQGGTVVNADITVICESPRIGAYREVMRDVIAADLGVDPARVNVKGTTTERLGFTGRGEGIAAQASTSINIKSF